MGSSCDGAGRTSEQQPAVTSRYDKPVERSPFCSILKTPKRSRAKLYALFDEYKAKRGSQPYLFRLGLAPVQKE